MSEDHEGAMREGQGAAVQEGEEFRVDGRRARRLLSGAQLEPFTRLDDLRSALAPLTTFGLIAALFVIGWLAWGHWWAVALVVVAIAAQQHALFVLAHEAAHYRMFSSRGLNDLVGRLAGMLGGISMCTYRVTHRLHHNHLYGRQDPDIALNGGYPRGAGYLAKKLLIDLTGWTAPKTYAYFFGAPAINSATSQAQRPLDDTSPSLRAAARSDRWWVAGFHVAMPCVAFALGGADGLLGYLVLWVLPLATVLQAILRLRAVAEHGAPAGYDSPLTAARTNLPGAGHWAGWRASCSFRTTSTTTSSTTCIRRCRTIGFVPCMRSCARRERSTTRKSVSSPRRCAECSRRARTFRRPSETESDRRKSRIHQERPMNAPNQSVREQVSEQEWQLRTDLAACYRLIALYGWDDLIFTHVSVRIPGPEHHFLINPYGLLFDEITASSLVKVDMECRPLLPTPHPVNPAGFVIHSTIHAAREDVVCVLHTHTTAGVGVSAQRDGLLPISQQASIVLTSLGYHDYEGIAVNDDERPRLARDLGSNSCLILRNHGLLTVGSSVAEAFVRMHTLESACRAQIAAQSGGAALTTIDSKVLAGVTANVKLATVKGSLGALAWPTLLRKLQRVNPGHDD